jgi:hypothetical protein
MVQKIEDVKMVEVGVLGTLGEPSLVVYAYRGTKSGKFYGLFVDHREAGDDRKPRRIMFDDIDRLQQIAFEFSAKDARG